MTSDLYWHSGKISRSDREQRNGHRSACLWLTGLSGSGKSTLAAEVERVLFAAGANAYVLDGDNVRHGLNKDLGFSHEDRHENIRRIGEVAKLFANAGTIVIAAFISPFRDDRRAVRSLFEPGRFVEIYVGCNLDTCARRDPKGLYQKANQGAVKEFTGITSPYEVPENPEIALDNNDGVSLESNVERIIRYLHTAGIVGFQS